MASTQYIDNGFSARFFSDVLQLYPQSSNQYRCTGISDVNYSQLGVLRCLSSSTTAMLRVVVGLVEITLVRAEQRVVSGKSRLVGTVRASQWARKSPPGLGPGGLGETL